MKKARFTETQILRVLKEVEGGRHVKSTQTAMELNILDANKEGYPAILKRLNIKVFLVRLM